MTRCLYSPEVGRLGTAGETFRIPAFLDDLSIEPRDSKKVGAGAAKPGGGCRACACRPEACGVNHASPIQAGMFSILGGMRIIPSVRPAVYAPHPPWARQFSIPSSTHRC